MKQWLKYGILAVCAACVAVFFTRALYGLDEGRKAESKEQLERAIMRAVAMEYAAKGAYPESLEKLVSGYGLVIDESAYDVFYMPVAENLPPQVDVVMKGEEREVRQQYETIPD